MGRGLERFWGGSWFAMSESTAFLVVKGLSWLLVSCIAAVGDLSHLDRQNRIILVICNRGLEVRGVILLVGRETFPTSRDRKYTPDHSALRKKQLDN